jgi:LL-diaminopimelate aminotransferase
MDIKPSKRITALPVYAFKLVNDRVDELRAAGVTPIDFGVGDPTTPTPPVVREACKIAVDRHATSGYPSYVGSLEFRAAVAAWTRRRFGVDLDPATEVTSTIGSKEGIFNFHEAFVDPGDLVLIPSPGYPPYSRGTWFAEGRAWFYPLDRANGYLPDLDAIPADVARAARVMWVNYPNSPSGVCPGRDVFERLYAWTRRHDVILASDEAYSEFYYGAAPPPTALEVGRDGVVVFNSLSKRSAMTCYRAGWVAGDRRIVEAFRKMKTNVDSGTPTFVQDAAVAALGDEEHVRAMREEYRAKRDVLVAGLKAAGLPDSTPEGTIYVWQRIPKGMTSLEFATLLMRPETAIVATPGSLIAEPVEGGRNPGEGHVRFALVPSLDDVRLAAERIARLKL